MKETIIADNLDKILLSISAEKEISFCTRQHENDLKSIEFGLNT